jgi:hypothetical protein
MYITYYLPSDDFGSSEPIQRDSRSSFGAPDWLSFALRNNLMHMNSTGLRQSFC